MPVNSLWRRDHPTKAFAKLLFLVACLGSPLIGQTIEPRALRAPAGESRTALWRGSGPLTAITSPRTTPALQFPIRAEITGEPGKPGLRFVIPPATPPGEYSVEVAGVSAAGQISTASIRLTVDPVKLLATPARPPVILLNGFQLVCTDTASTLTASEDTFGQLDTLLQNDGSSVLFFNNCAYGDISIEQLGSQLGAYIAGLRYTDGTPVPEVDLVAHSMGGLIARAYLSGKSQASGVFSPPVNPMVRKLVMIGTPHFGSYQAGYIGVQESEMALGNQFLWDLATWNQGQDDLRGVDALAVIGNAGTYGTTDAASDGVVSLTSGSLGFVEPDQRTRIVPYCHITPGFLTGLGMSCANAQGIADINSASHLTAEIVRSFLADTADWQSIGTPPSADPFLSRYGGGLVTLKGTNDFYFTDLSSVTFDSGAGSLVAGPSASVASIYYTEFAAGGSHSFSMTHSNGQLTTGTSSFVAGSGRALLFKFAPIITSVQSTVSTGLGGLTVASGSTIYVYGVGFSGTGLQLTANGAPLSISGSSDQQITASLPAGYTGLVRLQVSNSNGQHAVNIMTAAVPPPPMISLSTTQVSFAYILDATAPASQSITIANSGGGTLSWTASSSTTWLSVSPSSGTAPSTLSLSVNPSGLSVGKISGIVTVSGTGVTSQQINVILTIAAPPPMISLSTTQVSFAYILGATTPASQSITIANSGGGTLSWTASSSTTWLSVSPSSGTAPSTLSLSVNPAGLSAGKISGIVTVSGTGVTSQQINVILTIAAPQVNTPVITGISNAAGGQPGVFPGSFISIYGTNLTPVSADWSKSIINGQLPSQLDGVTVIIAGKPAYIYQMIPSQINAQAPDVGFGPVQVTVTTPSGTSAPFTVLAQLYGPAFWPWPGNQPVATHTDYTPAAKNGTISGTATSPAKPGEVITLWGTGFGPTTPPVPAGQLPTALAPKTQMSVTVTLNGANITVVSAVLSAYPSDYQIAVQIPASAENGDYALVATIGGVASPAVTLTVQQ